MNKTCDICQEPGTYKCPTCLIFYCSVKCCKQHRQTSCAVAIYKNTSQKDGEVSNATKKRKIDPPVSFDTKKLKSLKTDEELNKLLTNSHLRSLLITVDGSENADEIMQKAMQEPIFVEFADACLKAVNQNFDKST
ncbi:zinc finger HIT domain-containing protein 3 [Leptinotarsa decemlineata]|uniref:zinc finger HIT domain-containing protein 3 n=1 Tax=Leptinotarsa decemlineata TaxID=7539 RepID=UPI000C251BFC|nr:zinc finger HIT domain-containing protein 3 [Leptinotarsa decemlineata]